MKAVAKTAKGYKLSYKKMAATTDSYLPRGASRSISVCGSCHAVYMNKRWYVNDDALKSIMKGPAAAMIVCPACMKIRDDFPSGVVTLKGDYVHLHKTDLMSLVRNQEERARGLNPLERVIAVKDNGFGSIVISTTNERLAQRIGRAIKKAFHGEVAYHWSHDNKLVRVDWVRETD